jgi:Mg-chelatase subunit ChlD
MDALFEVSRASNARKLPGGDHPDHHRRRRLPQPPIRAGHAGSQQAGAAIHAIAVGNFSSTDHDELRNRARILSEGTRTTGGQRVSLLSEISVQQALDRLARELSSQYKVVYGRPESLIPPDKLEVSARRPASRCAARPSAEQGQPSEANRPPRRRAGRGALDHPRRAGNIPRRCRRRLAQRHGRRYDESLRHDLEEKNFSVFEDGVKQDLSFFTRKQQPIAMSLLLDSSASMEDKLPTLQTAAANFVKRLKANDMAQVIDFDSRVEIRQGFTSNQNELQSAIQQTSAGGSTSLYNAIYIALKELSKVKAGGEEDVRRQALVLFSDGEDTSSLISFDEVLELAKRSEVAIFTIALRGADTQSKGFTRLNSSCASWPRKRAAARSSHSHRRSERRLR